MIDPEAYRTENRACWEAMAGGWEEHRAVFQRAAEPVSHWMVEAIAPQPGHVVLELAAGLGDTGFLAAELVRPGGRVITTDGNEPMVEAAGRRAAELGLDNVEVRVMDAEWLDLDTASVDAVLCRLGYMLLADPEAALRETRRVLRPGGRMALAAWDGPEQNPWNRTWSAELNERGLTEPSDPDAPGMFAFAPEGRIEELLGATGFTGIVVEAVDIAFEAPSFDVWWDYQFGVSPSLSKVLGTATPELRDELHDAVEARSAPYRAEDGSYRLPGRMLVAAADA